MSKEATTIERPVASERVQDYIDTRAAYLEAISELNTSRSMNINAGLHYGMGEMPWDAIEAGTEYLAQMQDRIDRATSLHAHLAALIALGVEAEHREYQMASFEFWKATR